MSLSLEQTSFLLFRGKNIKNFTDRGKVRNKNKTSANSIEKEEADRQWKCYKVTNRDHWMYECMGFFRFFFLLLFAFFAFWKLLLIAFRSDFSWASSRQFDAGILGHYLIKGEEKSCWFISTIANHVPIFDGVNVNLWNISHALRRSSTIPHSWSLFFHYIIIIDVTYMYFNPILLRFRFSFRRNREEETIERQRPWLKPRDSKTILKLFI